MTHRTKICVRLCVSNVCGQLCLIDGTVMRYVEPSPLREGWWVWPKMFTCSLHSVCFSVSSSSAEADVRMLGPQSGLQTHGSADQEDARKDGWIPRCKDLTVKQSWGETPDCARPILPGRSGSRVGLGACAVHRLPWAPSRALQSMSWGLQDFTLYLRTALL